MMRKIMRKKYFRICVLAVILSLLFSLIAGCGKSGSGDAGNTEQGGTSSEDVPQNEANAEKEPAESNDASAKDDADNDAAADAFLHRQTIAAGNGISLAIAKDGAYIRASARSLIGSINDFGGKLTYNYAPLENDIVSVDAYEYYAALMKDGTVCTGVVSKDHGDSAYEAYGLSEADSWTDIAEVAMGSSQVVGLKTDGTVVTAGFSMSDFAGVDQWSDIIDVDAGENITVGLKADGTVVTCDLAPDVSGWTDIVAVSCSSNYVVGLKSDSTVVAASGNENEDPRTDVSGWSDIVAISAGLNHCVGLKSDGTVVSTKILDPEYDKGETDVDSWTDIVAISANYTHTLGLKSDGTVLCAGGASDNDAFSINDWNDIELP